MKMLVPITIVCLMSLVACGHRSPDVEAVQNNADALEAELENQANAMEAMATTAADQNAAEAMANVANDLQNASDNVATAADARIENMR